MRIKVQLALFVIFGCFIAFLESFVTLTPSSRAQVCVGEQLELTCATNETLVAWNFVPHLINAQGVSIALDWFISSNDQTQQLQSFTVNSTSFTFMRTSMQHSSPLVSMLIIVNSSGALDMITVRCTKIVDNERVMSALSTILVIGATQKGSLSPLIVNPRPVFEIDDVSVTLEWIAENGVVYSVAADQITDFRSIGRTVVNLTVLYNTPTNVTITATSCGQNSQTFTISVILNYGRCDDPLLPITDDSVMAVDYRNVALNGTVVTLTCPPGRMLNGPKSVMCTQTGQWEPNPSTVNCSAAEFEDATISGTLGCPIPSSSPDGYVIPYNSTDDRIRVTFACQDDCGGDLKSSLELHTAVCASNGDLEINPLNLSDNLLTVVVVSLVAMFLVSAVIIFIVGFLCGQWFGKRTLNQAPSTHPQKGPPGPIYESMLPSPIHEEQPIELEENVAYGPSTANL